MGLAPILAPILGGALLGFGGWRLELLVPGRVRRRCGAATLLSAQESRGSEATAAQARPENPLAVLFRGAAPAAGWSATPWPAR